MVLRRRKDAPDVQADAGFAGDLDAAVSEARRIKSEKRPKKTKPEVSYPGLYATHFKPPNNVRPSRLSFISALFWLVPLLAIVAIVCAVIPPLAIFSVVAALAIPCVLLYHGWMTVFVLIGGIPGRTPKGTLKLFFRSLEIDDNISYACLTPLVRTEFRSPEELGEFSGSFVHWFPRTVEVVPGICDVTFRYSTNVYLGNYKSERTTVEATWRFIKYEGHWYILELKFPSVNTAELRKKRRARKKAIREAENFSVLGSLVTAATPRGFSDGHVDCGTAIVVIFLAATSFMALFISLIFCAIGLSRSPVQEAGPAPEELPGGVPKLLMLDEKQRRMRHEVRHVLSPTNQDLVEAFEVTSLEKQVCVEKIEATLSHGKILSSTANGVNCVWKEKLILLQGADRHEKRRFATTCQIDLSGVPLGTLVEYTVSPSVAYPTRPERDSELKIRNESFQRSGLILIATAEQIASAREHLEYQKAVELERRQRSGRSFPWIMLAINVPLGIAALSGAVYLYRKKIRSA